MVNYISGILLKCNISSIQFNSTWTNNEKNTTTDNNKTTELCMVCGWMTCNHKLWFTKRTKNNGNCCLFMLLTFKTCVFRFFAAATRRFFAFFALNLFNCVFNCRIFRRSEVFVLKIFVVSFLDRITFWVVRITFFGRLSAFSSTVLITKSNVMIVVSFCLEFIAIHWDDCKTPWDFTETYT